MDLQHPLLLLLLFVPSCDDVDVRLLPGPDLVADADDAVAFGEGPDGQKVVPGIGQPVPVVPRPCVALDERPLGELA